MLLRKRTGVEYGIFRYAALYSELEGRLESLAGKYPGNMRYDVLGYSAEGRKLFLVTLAKDVSDGFLQSYSKERIELLNDPAKALAEIGSKKPLIPLLVNCNMHGTEISGTDGMLTFIDEVLSSPEKERYLEDSVIFISICMNPDGRSRGLDILNGNGVDLNRDWMAQTQPEGRALIAGCLKKYYPTILVDIHGYMSSSNILIDACTPPHNPFVEYDLLSPSILGNSEAMARAIKLRTNVDSDIASLMWEDGWDDYSPVYTTGYFMCNGAVTHTIEINFPSEEGAYISHCTAIGTLDYVHDHINELYKNQCLFYLRGIENKKENDFHADYYIIRNDKKNTTLKTVEQLIFNGISVYSNKNGDYAVPLAQPLRPLIHNMLWQGEDITDLTANCYDVSFYSYSVMRGLTVCVADKSSPEVNDLQNVNEITGYFSHQKKTSPPGAPRILAVTESGAIEEILTEAGYECHFLPFSELNTGWRIDPAEYDIMIVGGSKTLFWEDAFDDFRGVGYQNSWGLRGRGRAEVIHAAGEFKNLILFGYAGAKVNEAISRSAVKTVELAKRDSYNEREPEKYMFNPSNGSFMMNLETADPLCKGYSAEEIFYLVAPIAFESADGEISVRYAARSFINGFNKDKNAFDGHIAAFHKEDGDFKTVMFSFDPIYRGYTEVSQNMLLNAVTLTLG